MTTPDPAYNVRTTALCLSGGGFRAMLFHVGAMWRLNELGLLRTLDHISCVSGGSITGALVTLRWNSLVFAEDNRATAFEEQVVESARSLASIRLDERSVIRGALRPRYGAADALTDLLSDHLFGTATLADLPKAPVLTLNATDLASAKPWRFTSAPSDGGEGTSGGADVKIATAVAASSAWLPFLGPLQLGEAVAPETEDGRLSLADGGITDPLALRAVWDTCDALLVSDAARPASVRNRVRRDWLTTLYRNRQISETQVLMLQREKVLNAYRDRAKQGAYWAITQDTQLRSGQSPDSTPAVTQSLAETPTRLSRIRADIQERLINWGYVATDRAVGSWVGSTAGPDSLPYPGSLI